MTDESGFVDVYGDKLEVSCFSGKSTELPTLVLLHEGLGCIQAWKNFPQLLAEQSGCPVIVYSRAGYGNSSPRKKVLHKEFMHEQALEVLPRLLEELKISDYILVGHSDGGSISLIHAGQVPAPGLKGVVTMAPHVFVEPLTLKSIRELKVTYESSNNLKSGLAKYHGDKTDDVFREWLNVWLDPQFENWNIENCLADISVPQLILQGRGDEYGTLAQVESVINHSANDVSAQVFENCRHAVFRDQANKTLVAITAFISTL